ncbi:hypothetical protein KFU94_34780 [Chloroflexi bacterium TSY]|nr:hypothetical protein [Chloroflexi bacterium TSY]
MQKAIYVPNQRSLETIWYPKKGYFYLGLLLLFAYLMQDLLDIRWVWLMNAQEGESFKRWSGFVLTLYIASQWALSALRMTKNGKAAKRNYKIHNQLGAIAPLFFYIHAMKVGYAYLAILSLIYYTNMVVGLFNPEIINNRNKTFIFYWMIVHVTLSVLVVLLTFYHIFIVFYYQ